MIRTCPHLGLVLGAVARSTGSSYCVLAVFGGCDIVPSRPARSRELAHEEQNGCAAPGAEVGCRGRRGGGRGREECPKTRIDLQPLVLPRLALRARVQPADRPPGAPCWMPSSEGRPGVGSLARTPTRRVGQSTECDSHHPFATQIHNKLSKRSNVGSIEHCNTSLSF